MVLTAAWRCRGWRRSRRRVGRPLRGERSVQRYGLRSSRGASRRWGDPLLNLSRLTIQQYHIDRLRHVLWLWLLLLVVVGLGWVRCVR